MCFQLFANSLLTIFLQTGNSRFVPRTIVETSAILSLDEDIKLNSDEVSFDALKLLFVKLRSCKKVCREKLASTGLYTD